MYTRYGFVVIFNLICVNIKEISSGVWNSVCNCSSEKSLTKYAEMISITIVSMQNSVPEKLLCCDDTDLYNKCNVNNLCVWNIAWGEQIYVQIA